MSLHDPPSHMHPLLAEPRVPLCGHRKQMARWVITLRLQLLASMVNVYLLDVFLEVSDATLTTVRADQRRQNVSVQVDLFRLHSTAGLSLRYQVPLKNTTGPHSQLTVNKHTRLSHSSRKAPLKHLRCYLT